MSAAIQAYPQTQAVGFKRILIPTDFSENSRRAIPYALAFARQFGSEVYFVHAIAGWLRDPIPLEPIPKELDPELFEAEHQMKHLLESFAFADIPHSSRVQQGPIGEVLSSLIARLDIDLLVLSTHGRGGLKKLVLGSVAEEVLRTVPCPVLTLGKKAALAAQAPSFQRILFATDFGPGATKAAPLAFALADKCHGDLTLLHIVQPSTVVESRSAALGTPANLADEFLTWEVNKEEEAHRKLKELAAQGLVLQHEPKCVVTVDPASAGILHTAYEENIGLIVMGAARSSSAHAAAHIPWTVAHQVICEATCPVLTVSG